MATTRAPSLKPAMMLVPKQGPRAFPVDFDHSVLTTLSGDFGEEMRAGVIDDIQNVFIDNSQSASQFILTVLGVGAKGHSIVAQPNTQGYYPLPIEGVFRWQTQSSSGLVIPCIFYNIPVPNFVWGATPGISIVPPLTNAPVSFAPAAAGDNTLVLGVAAKTIKLYRLMITFGAGTNVQFFDGPSANNVPLTGLMNMFAGGSITFQPSGAPWLTPTAAGDSLVLNSSGAVNIGGVIGYQQS